MASRPVHLHAEDQWCSYQAIPNWCNDSDDNVNSLDSQIEKPRDIDSVSAEVLVVAMQCSAARHADFIKVGAESWPRDEQIHVTVMCSSQSHLVMV